MKRTLSEKGQVTIPKPLRDRLGLRPGDALEFEAEEGRLVARKTVARDPIDEVYGMLAKTDFGSMWRTTDDFIADVRGDRAPE